MRMENIQLPLLSRWFHLHYALSLRRFCLRFIDRSVSFSSSLFFPRSCREFQLSAASSTSALTFSRIVLAGNNETGHGLFGHGVPSKIRAADNSSRFGEKGERPSRNVSQKTIPVDWWNFSILRSTRNTWSPLRCLIITGTSLTRRSKSYIEFLLRRGRK